MAFTINIRGFLEVMGDPQVTTGFKMTGMIWGLTIQTEFCTNPVRTGVFWDLFCDVNQLHLDSILIIYESIV